MGRNYWYLLIRCKENLDGFQACFFPEKVAAAPLQIGESHDFLLENPCKPSGSLLSASKSGDPRVVHTFGYTPTFWMNRTSTVLKGLEAPMISPQKPPQKGVQLGMDLNMVSSHLYRSGSSGYSSPFFLTRVYNHY